MPDASAPLLEHLASTLEKDESQRKELIAKIKVGRRAMQAGFGKCHVGSFPKRPAAGCANPKPLCRCPTSRASCCL